MAPRAYWTGHIRLSLVSFPVRLYAAVNSANTIELHQLDEKTGERIRYQKVVPDKGPVPAERIVKGYEYERGRYVTIEDEELEHLKVESRHTIDLIQFVDTTGLDPIYFDRAYYVVPDGEIAEEAFVTVREALRRTGKLALGQVVLSAKERIAALRPCGKGMVLETLRYRDELRRAGSLFEDIGDHDIDKDQLALATQLIDNKTAKFDPGKFEDHYQKALKELIDAKIAGREPDLEEEPERRPSNVINLMDALKRSLSADSKGEPAKSEAAKRAPAKRPAAKTKSAAKKPATKSAAKKAPPARKPAARRKSA